MTLCSTDASD